MPLAIRSRRSYRSGRSILGIDRVGALFRGLRGGSDPIGGLLAAGVYSRSDGLGVLAGEVERARRYRRPLSLVLLQTGALRLEPAGLRRAPASPADLVGLGRLLLRQVRSTDGIAIDSGGAQFMLLLPETDLPAACAVIRRLETAIATSLALTVRWGLAQLPSCALTAEGLVQYALAGLDAEEVGAMEVAAQRGERAEVGVA